MPLRKVHGISVQTSNPFLTPFFCFPVVLPLLPQTHKSWQMNWVSLSLVTPTAWKSCSGVMEMKFYWRGIFKFLSVWSERVWVMSVKREAKKWNIRRECERVECERELYGEWSVWSVREECEGVGCECGVWECGVWESGVRVCTNPSSLSHNSFYLTCEEGVECGNKTNWH